MVYQELKYRFWYCNWRVWLLFNIAYAHEQLDRIFLQIRILLLPSKKQKHKSKMRHGENPQFMESFLFHRVNPGESFHSFLTFILFVSLKCNILIGELQFEKYALSLDNYDRSFLPNSVAVVPYSFCRNQMQRGNTKRVQCSTDRQ